ncbi:hypothetical protein RJ640_018987 [Escallonia rubra]|uniref:Gamma-cystathionase n=1 Tax=Escallonia rubra TaxID=112253 RepID=A0AA88QXH7_9ASTE|nr:hypothetical protein RJ640_018987 [Escallonia rubra]
MSAISSVLMQLCSSVDHVVASQTLYGGTHALLTHFSPRACNITTSFVDLRDHDTVKAAIVEGRTKVLYFEAVSNPTLTVADVLELCRIAPDKGLTVVVDNTFAPMIEALRASNRGRMQVIVQRNRVVEHDHIPKMVLSCQNGHVPPSWCAYNGSSCILGVLTIIYNVMEVKHHPFTRAASPKILARHSRGSKEKEEDEES